MHKLLLTNFPHCLVGWMTFCPEWLTGSPSLDTSSLLYLWCYLVFFNGLWVVIPFLLLWHSWKEIEVMHTSVSTTTRKKKRWKTVPLSFCTITINFPYCVCFLISFPQMHCLARPSQIYFFTHVCEVMYVFI